MFETVSRADVTLVTSAGASINHASFIACLDAGNV